MVPARQASAPPISQVVRTTSCVLMPETCASSALSAIARIALPSRERDRNRCSARTATMVRRISASLRLRHRQRPTGAQPAQIDADR